MVAYERAARDERVRPQLGAGADDRARADYGALADGRGRTDDGGGVDDSLDPPAVLGQPRPEGKPVAA